MSEVTTPTLPGERGEEEVYVSATDLGVVNTGNGDDDDDAPDDESPSLQQQRQQDPRIAVIIPRGCRIRDEFVCPITRELITDPVIAADGHTYDRSAIEQWLHGGAGAPLSRSGASGSSRRTSPKTGQPLEHLHLIPNHNLKRLLSDMIKEGGKALYCHEEGGGEDGGVRRTTQPPLGQNSRSHDDCDGTEEDETKDIADRRRSSDIESPVVAAPVVPASPRIALVHCRVLHCRCVGPPESDWNDRSFRFAETASSPLSGGRRRPHDDPHDPSSTSNSFASSSTFVQFSDATVSRRHFEIRFRDGRFELRDLGSAGGTFVRIPPRKRIELREGTMVMLGKHQLVASECGRKETTETEKLSDDQANNGPTVAGVSTGGAARSTEERRRLSFEFLSGADDDEDEASRIRNAEESSHNTVETNAQSRTEDEENDERANIGVVDGDEAAQAQHVINVVVDNDDNDEKIDDERVPLSTTTTITNRPLSEAATTRVSPLPSLPYVLPLATTTPITSLTPSPPPSSLSVDPPLITLRCFAPEGTPIQNRRFPVTRRGATLGRKQSNTISFSHSLVGVAPDGHTTFVGIDSSISGEHATVEYNDVSKRLELFDGVDDRVSTNGTWVRLSPMHEESDWYALDDRSEILIGTVRFQVGIEGVVMERDIYDEA